MVFAIAHTAVPDISTGAFLISALLGYSFLYLLPAAVVIFIFDVIFSIFDKEENKWPCRFLLVVAVICYGITNMLLLVDRVVFKMYGFHINGFVWNIITTEGGVESMGADSSTVITFIFIIAAVILIEAGFIYLSSRDRLSFFNRRIERSGKFLPWFAVLFFLIQGGIYGTSEFFGKSSVLAASEGFPQYQRVTFKGVLEKMGFESDRKTAVEIKDSKSFALNYPAEDIRVNPKTPKYNIVWLVAESWRADMLDKEIMPSVWDFAGKSQHFRNHYSSGNGTRMALFGMFYGLYGNYWFNFLNEQRPPVVMDILRENDYQIELFTSARFSYPEFDKTIFAGVSQEHIHEDQQGQGWQRDRRNVARILSFLDSRDKTRPFMAFMFFESPHARYYFPPECSIRKDYLEEFNYATVDLEKDIKQIWNRYVNSCYHLDTQIARITDYLRDNGLLENTIVIITGDHGEEFMEHGRWGHNSDFVNEQIRVPMVISVPGMRARIYEKLTSHLDLADTILPLLGVENPASDYSLGKNMFGSEISDYTVLADWDSLCYMDDNYKVVMQLKAGANVVTTDNDKAVADPSTVISSEMPRLLEVMKNSKRFTKAGKK
jgi:membrane-anchored protein YejM (alkaline phosphatase superfamily)